MDNVDGRGLAIRRFCHLDRLGRPGRQFGGRNRRKRLSERIYRIISEGAYPGGAQNERRDRDQPKNLSRKGGIRHKSATSKDCSRRVSAAKSEQSCFKAIKAAPGVSSIQFSSNIWFDRCY
jgi:hypothetical protein